MAKWEDKHMYDWLGWMRSISALHKKVEDWSLINYSFPRFMAFGLNLTFGSILKYTLIGLMAIPQTFEWIMRNIGDGVNKPGKVRGEGIKYHIRDFTYVMLVLLGLFVVIPFTLTWGLPNLISENIKGRKEKRSNRRRAVIENIRVSVNEDLSRWQQQDTIDGLLRSLRERGRVYKDFTPKKDIKAHKFNTERKSIYISPGVYTRDEFRIVQHREGNTSTARVARRNRRYINNIGNE